ncbi:unnamed protein product [Prunus armeniaca]|uniref:Uncharacterized protein n=1 Tax=Prunus armeniaca TaxID=36596 RepID=A0A6J5Y321_PRUAR|nr:unnamed protein product [Prunus armeniaca]
MSRGQGRELVLQESRLVLFTRPDLAPKTQRQIIKHRMRTFEMSVMAGRQFSLTDVTLDFLYQIVVAEFTEEQAALYLEIAAYPVMIPESETPLEVPAELVYDGLHTPPPPVDTDSEE